MNVVREISGGSGLQLSEVFYDGCIFSIRGLQTTLPYLQVLNLQIKIDIQISRFLRNIKILPARAKTY